MKEETILKEEQVEETQAEMEETEAAVEETETNHDEDTSNVEESNSQEIIELKEKVEAAENKYLRLYADFDNYRRRVKLDQEASEKYRAESLLSNLLPAIDNLERAMQINPDNEQTKALLTGVEMVYRGILDALESEGAKQIEAVNNEFDPHLHQAVMQTEEEGVESNIVVEEFQKGYILKDRVIRPSMVKVNK